MKLEPTKLETKQIKYLTISLPPKKQKTISDIVKTRMEVGHSVAQEIYFVFKIRARQ